MDPSSLLKVLDAQKQLLQMAKARKGQRATNKPSRQQLLFQFLPMRAPNSQEHLFRTCQINHAYPPSTTPLLELKPITISELRLETNHLGRVLIIRTIVEPLRIQAIQAAVEDERSEVDLLAVYNVDANTAPALILPQGAVFAIKEPYYKMAASGGYLIRVDHPSDIIRLPPTHSMIPIELMPRLLELDSDALEYKMAGNAAFKQKNYLQALEAYTEGLRLCVDTDEGLRYDLYRNRSIVNTYLQRYESAYSDAIAAIIPDTDGDATAVKHNVKALYRAGQAAHLSEDFSEAKLRLEKLLQLSPEDGDGANHLAKTIAALEESTTGNFDFIAMSNFASGGHKRLDHASFRKNVAVRTSGDKGRGIFATTGIKAGELVLVEKAFSVAYASELGNETHMILNLNTNKGRMGAHANLFYQLVQKMQHNPVQAKRVLDLFDGDYSPKCTAQLVDRQTVIDTFQVAAIMEHNAFGCPEKSTSDELSKRKAVDRESRSVGLWVVASYFNHACDASAYRSFMGDMMIVRATKDIKKGQEITLAYRAPDFNNYKMQDALQKGWQFKCDCSICTAEAKSPPTQRKERIALVQELETFLDKHSKASDYATNKTVIAQAEKIYTKLDATYDQKIFANVPRLPLGHLGAWLCGAHQTDAGIRKVVELANRVLRDLGYRVEVKGQKLHIDCTYCYAQCADMDAAMYAAHAYYVLGKVALGRQYEEFAKQRYQMFCGEMKGFVERYGDSGEVL